MLGGEGGECFEQLGLFAFPRRKFVPIVRRRRSHMLNMVSCVVTVLVPLSAG